MDWQTCMNRAMDYIEDNLSDEIDYLKAARMVGCSVWEFRRIFSHMAQISLSEYIRRRRLTLAAVDVQNEQQKIIDIALCYGYDSQAAFSRAFSQLHGVSPTSARDDGVILKAFPRLTFKFTLQGVEPMDYKVEYKDAFDIIGVKRLMTTENDAYLSGIGKMWEDFWKQKWWDVINKYSLYPNGNDPNGVGPEKIYSYEIGEPEGGGDFISGSFYHTIGVPYNGMDYSKDKNIFDDKLEIVRVPAGQYAIFVIPPNETHISEFTSRVYTEWLPSSGYRLGGGPEVLLSCSPTEGVMWLSVTAN